MLFSLRRAAALTLALLLLGSVSGCAARRRIPPNSMPYSSPRQPGTFTPPQPDTQADLSLHVADLVAGQQAGAGKADAIVVGNVALVAVPDLPIGVGRGPINAPPNPAGRRGGGTHTGLTTQGPTPSSNPGAPGHVMPPTAGGMADTGGQPGQAGTAMDMMTRMADNVRFRLPQIVEVRFVTRQDEAARVRAIATELRAGRPITPHVGEVAALMASSVEAGTVWMPGGAPVRGSAPGPGTTTGARTGTPPGSP